MGLFYCFLADHHVRNGLCCSKTKSRLIPAELARSAKSRSFDTYSALESEWFSVDGFPLGLLSYKSNGKMLTGKCESIGDGICDVIFNDYDDGFEEENAALSLVRFPTAGNMPFRMCFAWKKRLFRMCFAWKKRLDIAFLVVHSRYGSDGHSASQCDWSMCKTQARKLLLSLSYTLSATRRMFWSLGSIATWQMAVKPSL